MPGMLISKNETKSLVTLWPPKHRKFEIIQKTWLFPPKTDSFKILGFGLSVILVLIAYSSGEKIYKSETSGLVEILRSKVLRLYGIWAISISYESFIFYF